MIKVKQKYNWTAYSNKWTKWYFIERNTLFIFRYNNFFFYFKNIIHVTIRFSCFCAIHQIHPCQYWIHGNLGKIGEIDAWLNLNSLRGSFRRKKLAAELFSNSFCKSVYLVFHQFHTTYAISGLKIVSNSFSKVILTSDFTFQADQV